MQDKHPQQLKEYIILGWPTSRNEILQEVRPYWTMKYDLAVTGGIIMKADTS